MKISNDLKKSILAERDRLTVSELAKKYNISKLKVKQLLESDKNKNKWFFLVLILIPILFFVLLELSLRIFDYGYNTSQWVNVDNGKYILNPDIPKRYFNNIKSLPKTSEDLFDQEKKNNAFRVFILGGSSAAGYPYMPTGAFSRYIRKRLELVYPHTTIEVVNLSMTAVGSYTLLDLMPGTLKQKPDLILIYAGHNEYYGALGVGSLESVNTPRWVVKLMLSLNRFKTTQLIRNSISGIVSLFGKDKQEKTGTLMSRMAKDQSIILNSEKFKDGVEQFKDNLEDILDLAKDYNVPVIIGRLTSNLKDQKPFISAETPGHKNANQTYKEAQIEFGKNNIQKADSLFKLAKDLDALRFRAPEKMNTIIDELGTKFKVKVVHIDSIFDASSADGIVGNNFMVDHLHPNLKGYELMGKAFYEAMDKTGNLPNYEKPIIAYSNQDSLTKANFNFTKLDSTVGNYIVALLKSDWPFTVKKHNQSIENLFSPNTFIDSIAVDYLENKISWADAHLSAATYSLKKDDIKNYLSYMNALIYQYPGLVDISTAVKYFYGLNKINPADYTTKRLGLIALYNNQYDDAIRYLAESKKAKPSDTQIIYGLALAHLKKKEFKSALNEINNYLKLDPNNTEAKTLKNKILSEDQY